MAEPGSRPLWRYIPHMKRVQVVLSVGWGVLGFGYLALVIASGTPAYPDTRRVLVDLRAS